MYNLKNTGPQGIGDPDNLTMAQLLEGESFFPDIGSVVSGTVTACGDNCSYVDIGWKSDAQLFGRYDKLPVGSKARFTVVDVADDGLVTLALNEESQQEPPGPRLAVYHTAARRQPAATEVLELLQSNGAVTFAWISKLQTKADHARYFCDLVTGHSATLSLAKVPPGAQYRVGQQIPVVVTEVRRCDDGKIHVYLAHPDWQRLIEQWMQKNLIPECTMIPVTVIGLTDNDVLVRVDKSQFPPGEELQVNGKLRISQRARDANPRLAVGAQLSVLVVGVEPQKYRFTAVLPSQTKLSANQALATLAPGQSFISTVVSAKYKNYVLVRLPCGVQAILPKRYVGNLKSRSLSRVFKCGDQVEVTVVAVNPARASVQVSCKLAGVG